MNVLTGAIVWVLILLSVILTASVLFPSISSTVIVGILAVGAVVGAIGGAVAVARAGRGEAWPKPTKSERREWRMPPSTLLERPELQKGHKIGLIAMRAYLAVAVVLVIVKVVVVAVGG
jgi:hypothetical protein